MKRKVSNGSNKGPWSRKVLEEPVYCQSVPENVHVHLVTNNLYLQYEHYSFIHSVSILHSYKHHTKYSYRY